MGMWHLCHGNPGPQPHSPKPPHPGPKEDCHAGWWGAFLLPQQCPPHPWEKRQASQEGAVGEQADPRALDERANGPRQALKPAAGETSTHVTPAPTATSPSVRACPSGHCPQNLMVRLWLLTWGPQVEANSKTPPGMPGSEGLRGPGICLHAQAGGTGLDEHRLCPCPLHQWEGQADSPRAM